MGHNSTICVSAQLVTLEVLLNTQWVKVVFFSAIVRPREKHTLRAIRAEAQLRKAGVSKYNKRFRSWAHHRVRKYNIALPVVLTTDTALMDAKYITAFIQKAVKFRKHD